MRLTGEENRQEIYKIREESNGINHALAGSGGQSYSYKVTPLRN
jgi:hypothetical protein